MWRWIYANIPFHADEHLGEEEGRHAPFRPSYSLFLVPRLNTSDLLHELVLPTANQPSWEEARTDSGGTEAPD